MRKWLFPKVYERVEKLLFSKLPRTKGIAPTRTNGLAQRHSDFPEMRFWECFGAENGLFLGRPAEMVMFLGVFWGLFHVFWEFLGSQKGVLYEEEK